MPQLTPGDILGTPRHHRGDWSDGPGAADLYESSEAGQQAGLAALIALAKRISADADTPNTFWLHADAASGTGELPMLSPAADAARMAASPGAEIVRHRTMDTAALVLNLRERAHGNIARISRYGPVIAPGVRRRSLRKSTFSRVLSRSDRVLIGVLSACWAVCLASYCQDLWIRNF